MAAATMTARPAAMLRSANTVAKASRRQVVVSAAKVRYIAYSMR